MGQENVHSRDGNVAYVEVVGGCESGNSGQLCDGGFQYSEVSPRPAIVDKQNSVAANISSRRFRDWVSVSVRGRLRLGLDVGLVLSG